MFLPDTATETHLVLVMEEVLLLILNKFYFNIRYFVSDNAHTFRISFRIHKLDDNRKRQ